MSHWARWICVGRGTVYGPSPVGVRVVGRGQDEVFVRAVIEDHRAEILRRANLAKS